MFIFGDKIIFTIFFLHLISQVKHGVVKKNIKYHFLFIFICKTHRIFLSIYTNYVINVWIICIYEIKIFFFTKL